MILTPTVSTGRTLRRRKERVAKHLKRGAIDKETESFLKRVFRIPLHKPFEEAYYTHRLWMFFRETREKEEDIRRMFCEAREKMRVRITLKKKSNPGQFAIPCTMKGIEFPHASCDAGASDLCEYYGTMNKASVRIDFVYSVGVILLYENLCGGNASHRTRARNGSLLSNRTPVPLGHCIATELEPKLSRYVATELEKRLGRCVATELEQKLDRYVATELEPKLGCYVATELGCYVATQLEQKLGRYIATELEPKLGRYLATEHSSAWSLRSDRALPKRRYDISPCILVYPSILSPEDRSEPISRSPPF
ncbi:hypothetical protein F2Q70_00004357 [Brassica cretica]|uniref:Uncharacterized protein n=1 Tax=Brassica cretica TaxID=69181 RepID=A0A8S9IWN1_BRACR|nr:hypothetical protein F2Q70_00004357 [Brassica cretica]